MWLLTLPVNLSKVQHRQHRCASPRSAEQCSFEPVVVSIRTKRPRDPGTFGPLQVLMYGTKGIQTTAVDLPQPQRHFKLQSKYFFDPAHGQSPVQRSRPGKL
jgi:hypothetical protein